MFFTPSKNFFCYGTHALAWILAYILTNTVTDVKYFFIKKGVHEICFELTKQISVILRENPPLRDDVASAACFLSLRHMEGHAFDKCRKFTLSAEALRQIEGKIQKCDFGFFERFFWVHENLGELTPAIFRDWEENPAVFVVARRYLRAARDTRSATLGAAAPPLSLTKKVLSC